MTVRPPVWTTRAAAIVPPPRRTDVDVRMMDEEMIIADGRTESTFHLNATARRVWDACDGRTTTIEMARDLHGVYDVEADDALDDVEQLVAFFAESGLLDWERNT